MNITDLPEDCISHIVSFTSPKDACRCSLLHSALRAAADSDYVWERFLPSDYKQIISEFSSPYLNSLSKKRLYFHLCDHPALVADNIMTLSLAKRTGKKCYMVGAKGLCILWSDVQQYWKWTAMPESRFSQVAELDHVWWLEVKTSFETKLLSPNTIYGVYLVYKFAKENQGFGNRQVEFILRFKPSEIESRKVVIIDVPQPRNDGWNEVEMGEFFNEDKRYESVFARFFHFDENATVEGLIVEGIEFRPKIHWLSDESTSSNTAA